MNSVRKLIGLILLMAFALMSGASFAANKEYSVSIVSLPATTSPATLAFKFVNGGNSSFNSLTIQIPTGYTVPLSGISADRATSTFRIVSLGGSNYIYVENINLPTGTGQSFTVTLRDVFGVCGSAQLGTWVTQTWTGSSVGGQMFTLVQPVPPYPTSSTYPSTTLTTTCVPCSTTVTELASPPRLPVNTNPPQAYFGNPNYGLATVVTNKDQTACADGAPYSFNFDPSVSPQTASFVAPTGIGKSIKAQYVLLWAPIAVADANQSPIEAGWQTRNPRPYLGWLKDKTDPTGTKYKLIKALWCKDDGLGAAADVLPTIPDIQYFRDLRDIEGYPDYGPGKIAPMCVAQTGSTAIGDSFVQFWHKITDYVDGAVSWGAD